MRGTRALAVAAVAAVMGIAAGCGGDDDGGGSKLGATKQDVQLKKGAQVRLWIMNNGPDPVADTEKIVAPFEQRTGVDVKVELVGWDVQFDRIRNAAVSGEGPDVTQAGTTQVPFFAALGGFDDITSRIGDLGGQEAYPKGVWQTTQVTDKPGTWAVPWFTEARAIYYRKDVLEKAGIDPATAFSNWDSFRATLQKIKDTQDDIKPFGSPGKKAFDLVHHVMPFVWDAGGAEISDDAKKSTIASPQAQQGVDFFASLLRDGLADPSQLERDGTQVENQFKAGRIAVWIGGPWTLGSVERTDDENWTDEARENVGIAPMPAGPEGKAFTFVGGSNLMLFKNSKNKEEAWALMRYLSEPKVQTDYANLLGMFPSKTAPQQETAKLSPNHEAFFTAIQQGRTFKTIPQWGQIENAYKSRLGTILDRAAGKGGKSLDQAGLAQELEKAQQEADGLLSQSAG